MTQNRTAICQCLYLQYLSSSMRFDAVRIMVWRRVFGARSNQVSISMWWLVHDENWEKYQCVSYPRKFVGEETSELRDTKCAGESPNQFHTRQRQLKRFCSAQPPPRSYFGRGVVVCFPSPADQFQHHAVSAMPMSAPMPPGRRQQLLLWASVRWISQIPQCLFCSVHTHRGWWHYNVGQQSQVYLWWTLSLWCRPPILEPCEDLLSDCCVSDGASSSTVRRCWWATLIM